MRTLADCLGSKIRVLIVDGAVLTRRLIFGEFASDPGIEVVGSAPNATIALAKIARLAPDVITLDPDLPDIGALDMLRAIRTAHPLIPVVLFSASSESLAGLRNSARALGAADTIAAPIRAGAGEVAHCIREELIPRIKSLRSRPADRPQQVEIVVIGISTGGPSALPILLSALPADFPVPLLIVQHMPAVFTRLLAERLASKASIGISEAIAGDVLRAGHAWLAPGEHHMVVARTAAGARLELNQDPPVNSCRPSADILFNSVAGVFGSAALAVVMTGMGCDGLSGCEAIRAAGGQVIIQDRESSVVWGMPGHVARAGLASAILPLDALGAEIVRRVQARRPALHAS